MPFTTCFTYKNDIPEVGLSQPLCLAFKDQEPKEVNNEMKTSTMNEFVDVGAKCDEVELVYVILLEVRAYGARFLVEDVI